MGTTRRDFIRTALCATCGAMLLPWDTAFAEKEFSAADPHVKEAYFYERLENGLVRCGTCPNRCVLAPEKRGRCRSKLNIEGKLYSIAYGNPCAVNVDPVEKKPLFHFYPGTMAFSIAAAGCNFRCLNCQNWEISQTSPDKTRNYNLPPEEVVSLASRYKCHSIAYTYSEPSTFYEYMVDTSVAARKAGIRNIWVTNGYMSQKALNRLCEVIDAANIDLKTFSESIYMELNGGHLAPVLESLKTVHKRGVWLEITNLVIPTYNDNMEMVKKMCTWILENLGPDYPVHFSRFFPLYKLVHLPPTPEEVLVEARKLAIQAGLHHVYIGNIPGLAGNTVCPGCRREVIQRRGYTILASHLNDGKCKFCQTSVSGRWA